MDLIAVNGQEITLGCFINLHEKMACADNGLFLEINYYYHVINAGPLKLMHFNDASFVCTI